MAYVINDDCISCGACAAGCPVEAISEGASHYEINADLCVDCGACAGTCPVGAPNPQQLYIVCIILLYAIIITLYNIHNNNGGWFNNRLRYYYAINLQILSVPVSMPS